MHKFEKLLEKKGKKISDVEKRAKSDVLSDLQGEGSGPMEEKLRGLKKTPAAPSNEGFEAGLGKAEDIFGSTMDGQDYQEEGESLEEKPMEECTPEEIDEKIQTLMDYKKELLNKGQE